MAISGTHTIILCISKLFDYPGTKPMDYDVKPAESSRLVVCP